MPAPTTIDGILLEDPVLRFAPAPVVNVRVSYANEGPARGNSPSETATSSVTLTLWLQLAETCAKELRAGDHVLVIGRLQERPHGPASANRPARTSYEVVVESIGRKLASA